MTQKLILLLIPCLLAVGIAACGDDDPGLAPVNKKFAFRVDDTFTYDYYERDAENNPIDTSKQVVVWTVVDTDLSMFSRGDVTEIEEVRYEADGTTEISRSTIYMNINSDGQVEVYDLFGTVLNRFSGDINLADYTDQIPKQWVTVGSTNDANARVLMDDPQLVIKRLENLVLPEPLGTLIGPIDINLQLGVRTEHLGAGEITVDAGTYEKAYSTDTKVRVQMQNAEEINVPGIGTFPAGTNLIQDSIGVHYDFDIDAGMLMNTMESKQVLVNNTLPVDVTGFEMELTAVQRATVEE